MNPAATTPERAERPLVLVPACNRRLGEHPFHVVGRKYVDAVRLAGALPLVVPNARDDELAQWLAIADGLLLTGSPSNVHPARFDEAVRDPALPLDAERDAATLPLVRRALDAGVPVLGICRGAQEANVALGGSLHQAVHELEGHLDHRSDDDEPVEAQYAEVHDAIVEPGGLLAGLLGESRIRINSLHGQAVKRLAEGLRVEARAPDGVVEAFTRPLAPAFNLFVQWHPEWRAADNPVSRRLLAAFGDACADRRRRRREPVP